MKKFLFLIFLTLFFWNYTQSNPFQDSLSKVHKPKKKHHRPYNHCPVKRGTDKKLIKGYYYGTASFYHSMFNGRKTSNGERFNSKKMTGAHKSLRLGTYVEIYNLRNHRRVFVKINDRLPPNSCRMIDLTRASANRLNMIHQGLAKVKLRVVPKSLGRKKVKEEMEEEMKHELKKLEMKNLEKKRDMNKAEKKKILSLKSKN
jgi:rare lipoprotein A